MTRPPRTQGTRLPTAASPPKTPPKGPTTNPPAAKALPNAEPAPGTIVLAAVIGAHGIGGEMRLKVFADDLSPHRSFNDGTLTLTSLRDGTIARFAEVTDRTGAEAMRGTALTVPRSSLPPLEDGEYYHADLLGLAVVSTGGDPLGRVVAIDNFGAGDVIEIERPAAEDGAPGKRFMVPMTPAAVPEWDAARMVVDAAFVE